MTTMTIYVCDHCRKRSDTETFIRITNNDHMDNPNMVRANWKIFVGASTNRPKRESTFGHDAHLCSKECLLLWLGFSVQPVSQSTSQGDSK